MKKLFVMAAALLVSVTAVAQKKELKEIEKQINKGDLNGAKEALKALKNGVEGTEFAAQYYFLEGKTNLEFAKKNISTLPSLQATVDAFNKVKELEKNGKQKYTSQISSLTDEAAEIAYKKGFEDYSEHKNYKNAAIAFEQFYRLKNDTVFLYNAATSAYQDKDLGKAVKLFEELKNIGYDGAETLFLATNKQTKKEETFTDKNQRDLMIKAGTHEKPRTERTPSKRADIVKYIGAIYVEQGKNGQAIKAFEDARKMYPKDANIILQEAYIYHQLDNKEKFKELMQEAIRLEPNNADLHFNIGVINMQQDNIAEARKSFEQALKLKPNYAEAAINISTSYINEGNALISQMNALGNTKADTAKFDELRELKDNLFKKSASVLEDFIKANGNNTNILEQLKNIYAALSDTANFQRIKKLLGE